MAPRKMAEDRISRISASDMAQPLRFWVSTTRTSAPSQRAVQPSPSKMRTEASTSRRRGQPRSSTCPAVSSVAAKMGKTLFFAPWISVSPSRRRPPLTIN